MSPVAHDVLEPVDQGNMPRELLFLDYLGLQPKGLRKINALHLKSVT